MKNSKKRLLSCLLLTSGVVLVLLQFIYLNNVRKIDASLVMRSNGYSTIYLSSQDKIRFANEKNSFPIEKKPSEDKIMELIEKIVLEATDSSNAKTELSQYGIYHLEQKTTKEMRNDNKLITRPYIFYNVMEQTWIVAWGGKWLNTDWNCKILNGEMGGGINFGLNYIDDEGSHHVEELETYSWIGDGTEYKKSSITMGTIGDEFSGNGAVFGYHDYTYGILPRKYVGRVWFGYVKYAKEFENFGGEITAIYEQERFDSFK